MCIDDARVGVGKIPEPVGLDHDGSTSSLPTCQHSLGKRAELHRDRAHISYMSKIIAYVH
jgi:hypothetical protein